MKILQTTLRSRIFLKATSLVLGFFLWTIIGDLFIHRKWLTVPVCFYNTSSKNIKAPESVMVELEGKRSHLKHIQDDTLALHIDAERLFDGSHHISITQEQLLLPSTVTVTTVIPQSIIVHIAKENI